WGGKSGSHGVGLSASGEHGHTRGAASLHIESGAGRAADSCCARRELVAGSHRWHSYAVKRRHPLVRILGGDALEPAGMSGKRECDDVGEGGGRVIELILDSHGDWRGNGRPGTG